MDWLLTPLRLSFNTVSTFQLPRFSIGIRLASTSTIFSASITTCRSSKNHMSIPTERQNLLTAAPSFRALPPDPSCTHAIPFFSFDDASSALLHTVQHLPGRSLMSTPASAFKSPPNTPDQFSTVPLSNTHCRPDFVPPTAKSRGCATVQYAMATSSASTPACVSARLQVKRG